MNKLTIEKTLQNRLVDEDITIHLVNLEQDILEGEEWWYLAWVFDDSILKEAIAQFNLGYCIQGCYDEYATGYDEDEVVNEFIRYIKLRWKEHRA